MKKYCDYNNNYYNIGFKGYIDLSKRRVSPEDVQKCEEKFNKSKSGMN